MNQHITSWTGLDIIIALIITGKYAMNVAYISNSQASLAISLTPIYIYFAFRILWNLITFFINRMEV